MLGVVTALLAGSIGAAPMQAERAAIVAGGVGWAGRLGPAMRRERAALVASEVGSGADRLGPGSGAVYSVELVPDLTAPVAMAAAALLIDLEKRAWVDAPPCSGEPLVADEAGVCDPRTINVLDRWVTDNSSAGADRLSDLLLGAMIAAPLLAVGGEIAFGETQEPERRLAEDLAVASQAVTAAALVVDLTKVSVRRPRPLTYNARVSREERFEGDARLSFPSGHTALAFASATVTSYALIARHDDASGFIGAAILYGAAAAVAYLRVAAGKHFVTDVLAGAAIGIAAGMVTALAHRREESIRVGEAE